MSNCNNQINTIHKHVTEEEGIRQTNMGNKRSESIVAETRLKNPPIKIP